MELDARAITHPVDPDLTGSSRQISALRIAPCGRRGVTGTRGLRRCTNICPPPWAVEFPTAQSSRHSPHGPGVEECGGKNTSLTYTSVNWKVVRDGAITLQHSRYQNTGRIPAMLKRKTGSRPVRAAARHSIADVGGTTHEAELPARWFPRRPRAAAWTDLH